MPRKDLTDERTAQILDAFERCVIKHGLSGTSLEEIAEEAGVKRSILRHYVGNRHEMEIAMTRRFVERYQQDLNDLSLYLRAHPVRAEALVESLLPKPSAAGKSDVVVAEALIAAGASISEIRVLMAGLIADTVSVVRNLLRLDYPKAPARQVWAIAYGVVGICYNHESLTALELSPKYRKGAKAAAMALIGTLGGSH